MKKNVSRSRVNGFLDTQGRRIVNGAGEEVLLDDVALNEISKTLQKPVSILQSDGKDFVYKLAGL